jgi:uncharacterized membrane protein YfcA
VLWMLLFLVGIFAGTFGSLLGLGGGVILVPSLLFLSSFFPGAPEITPQQAVGTSLILIIITSLSSVVGYAKKKRIDYRSAFLFFMGSAPGAILGAWLTKFFDRDSFNIYFGLFLIFMFFLLIYRKNLKNRSIQWKIQRNFIDDEGVEYTYGYSPIPAFFIALIVGTLSSLFGIGGGALLVPFMLVFFGFPPHIATATSMMNILLSSIVGSGMHIIYGHIIWLMVLVTAPGSWIGGKLGVMLSSRLSGNRIEWILRGVLLLFALRMLWQGVM